MKRIIGIILILFILVGCRGEGPIGHSPVIIPKDEISITLQQYTAMPTWSEYIIAKDTEDGIITYLEIDDGNVNMNVPGRYHVIYTVTDNDKNVTKYYLNVDVLEVGMPKIIGADKLVLEVGSDEPDWLDGVYAYDGLLTLIPLTKENVDKNNLDLNKVGQYQVIYTVETDYNQTLFYGRNVKVVDIQKPEFKGLGELVFEVGSDEPNWLEGVSVVDSLGNPWSLSMRNVYKSNVRMDLIGSFYVTYTFTDLQNKTTTVNRKVTIIHNEKPTIEGLKRLSFPVNSSGVDWLAGLKAYDSLGNEIKLYSRDVDADRVDFNTAGTYDVFYYVTDKYGLTNIYQVFVDIIEE